ncbi:hypothetical protein K3G63_04860 [Hymenobacter sp. HSC-4F20]|uniref:hypothetical protein n=1 Tax=Hymenobacter sp. HSC-4F20 TaxID=2864135 RepID=UPI001C73D778|nr:hypothetical protein [Hymenobacter sp. HSC-4F20]MBX0289755.1 hypothetical protein [Hymenobacter sp. HSC-4F20]
MEQPTAHHARRKAGVMRLPTQGNALWIAYQQLSREQQRNLKDAIQTHRFTFNTFLYDTALDRPLDLVPFGRLDFYCSFFATLGQSGTDFFAIARQEREELPGFIPVQKREEGS